MRLFKKIWSRIKRFLWRYKYIISLSSITLFLMWLFCLPPVLFNDPTSTVLLDKEGNLLGATIADDGQWRFPHNDTVPEKFAIALLQFEDREFQSHIGVNFGSLLRATYQNITSNERKSGGSTITMQLMRMSRKGKPRTIWQKIIEIFWATRAEWRYTKEEILSLYASNAPMGGNVVGLDAASWRYFGHPAKDLSWAESATLAVLPNAPSLMHPGKNRDELLEKRNRLLNRLLEVAAIDSLTWELSKLEKLPEAPHPIPRFTPQLLDRAIKDGHKGTIIQTSIDLNLQKRTNQILQNHHERLKENEIYNGAILVTRVSDGKVVAYTGNVPNISAIHGKDVDIIQAPRSSGSILKPFLYASAMQFGEITPEMLLEDVPTVMSGYSPKNYHLKYDGVVKANEVLARSLNVPMVRLLARVGVDKFLYILKRLQFSSINRTANHYGLSLILGGAEVTLWDLVKTYSSLSRQSFQDTNGLTSFRHPEMTYMNGLRKRMEVTFPFNSAVSWFTLKAMKEVKRPEDDLNWDLFATSQEISWKTGTSFGFRDAWAVGTNGNYTVGVWIGNGDGEGRPGLIGRKAAAPVLFDVFSSLPNAQPLEIPSHGMIELKICQQSGMQANENCAQTQTTTIPAKCEQVSLCTYHKAVFLDSTEQFRVTSSCYDLSRAVKKSWFILPATAEYFFRNHSPNYKSLPALLNTCNDDDLDEATIAIIYPKENSTIYIPKTFDEEKKSIFFEATHISSEARLFWHLDNIFLGSTISFHQLKHLPMVGSHVLTVIDENGISASVAFDVIESEEN